MSSERINVSVPAELFARLEAARGDVSRSRFVVRALESALRVGLSTGEAVADARPSASSRAPAKGTPSVRDTWAR